MLSSDSVEALALQHLLSHQGHWFQVEPTGPGHRAPVCDGHHPGGDRDQRRPPHQPHHHSDYESAENCPRYLKSIANYTLTLRVLRAPFQSSKALWFSQKVTSGWFQLSF